jgi:hypothetical protein
MVLAESQSYAVVRQSIRQIATDLCGYREV